MRCGGDLRAHRRLVKQAEAGRAASAHARESDAGHARASSSSTSPIDGRDRSAGASRSFRGRFAETSRSAASSKSAMRQLAPTPVRASTRETRRAVGTATPGLTSTSASCGKRRRGVRSRRGPPSRPAWLSNANRHIRAQRGRDFAQQLGLIRRRSTVEPARAASPPHRPSRRRCPRRPEILGQAICGAARTPAERQRAARSDKIVLVRRQGRRRTARRSPATARPPARKSASSPDIGETRQDFQSVKAVGALVADMQEQIDLRRREDANSARLVTRQAVCSFFSIAGFSSASGPKASAWFHWKLRIQLAADPPIAHRPDDR